MNDSTLSITISTVSSDVDGNARRRTNRLSVCVEHARRRHIMLVSAKRIEGSDEPVDLVKTVMTNADALCMARIARA